MAYLKPILLQITNNIMKNIRLNSDVIKCPGCIRSEYRNMCNYKCSIISMNIPICEISLDIFRIKYVLDSVNSFICPDIRCGQIVEIDSDYIGNNIVCNGAFKTSWCRNCMISPYHHGKSCIEVEADNNNTENGKLIYELKEKGILKFCPQCRSPCIKNSGCSKMVCSVCNIKWCWICSAINIDYCHYNSNGVDECSGRLWEGVDENGNAIQENDEYVNNIQDDNPDLLVEEEFQGPYIPRMFPRPVWMMRNPW
jgi:hypothetical protein